jgi:hypothetical protein
VSQRFKSIINLAREKPDNTTHTVVVGGGASKRPMVVVSKILQWLRFQEEERRGLVLSCGRGGGG